MEMLPSGTYFETYRQSKALIHTKLQWGWFIGFLLFLYLLPFFAGAHLLSIAIMMCIILISVLGLQIVIGYTGQLNLGQSGFMGVGAYLCALLANQFNLPFWLAIPGGGIGAAVLGAMFGIPASRVKGFYLALTTLAAQFIFTFAIVRLPYEWFGGYKGLPVAAARIGDLVFDTDQRFYFLAMSLVVIFTFFTFNLARSRVGRAFMAIRDNENAAEIMGVHVSRYKVLSFGICALYAGISGSVWAYYVRYVGIDQFTLWHSIWYVGMIIIGGLGNTLGAILGVVAIRGLQEILNYAGPALSNLFPSAGGGAMWFASMNILLGGLIVVFILFEPKGLAHRWNLLKVSYRKWPFPY
jgi:branched-chain amino acid transport system permease protein